MNDSKIVEWNADQRTAQWVRKQLNITVESLAAVSKRHGLVWPFGAALSCICPNGHDTYHVGYKDGCCGRCGATCEIPDHLVEFGGRLAKRFCKRGHDTRQVGRFFVSGKAWCGKCHGVKAKGRNNPVGRRTAETEAVERTLERTSDEYLRLRDLLYMTPQRWLRDEIEEQIRRLRA